MIASSTFRFRLLWGTSLINIIPNLWTKNAVERAEQGTCDSCKIELEAREAITHKVTMCLKRNLFVQFP